MRAPYPLSIKSFLSGLTRYKDLGIQSEDAVQYKPIEIDEESNVIIDLDIKEKMHPVQNENVTKIHI